jgi:hypothetical protein
MSAENHDAIVGASSASPFIRRPVRRIQAASDSAYLNKHDDHFDSEILTTR